MNEKTKDIFKKISVITKIAITAIIVITMGLILLRFTSHVRTYDRGLLSTGVLVLGFFRISDTAVMWGLHLLAKVWLLLLICPIIWGLYEWREHNFKLGMLPVCGAILYVVAAAFLFLLEQESFDTALFGGLCLLLENVWLLLFIFPIMWGLYKWRGHNFNLGIIPVCGAILYVVAAVVCYKDNYFENYFLGIFFTYFIFIWMFSKAYYLYLKSIREKTAFEQKFYRKFICQNWFFILLLCVFWFVILVNYCTCDRMYTTCYVNVTLINYIGVAYMALWALTQSVWFTKNWREKWFSKLVWLVVFVCSVLICLL